MQTMQLVVLLSLSLGSVLAHRKQIDLSDEALVTASSSISLKMHTVARDNSKRNPAYPERAEVDDAHVFWSVEWPEYEPTDYTHEMVLTAAWADPVEVVTNPAAPEWNDMLHRTYFTCQRGMTATSVGKSSSHCFGSAPVPEKNRGKWNIPHDGNAPLNPMGRTGMRGRGLLGKFGANHAADPLVTRVHEGELEIALIKRSDGGKMAIPGGMVEAGDTVSATLSKEFEEEALRGNKPSHMSDAEWEAKCTVIADRVKPLFDAGTVIYTGYVDDPRNTDNAWMETAAYHFHGTDGLFDEVQLQAGDDAVGVKWVKVVDAISDSFDMYASHKELIEEMYRRYQKSR